MSSINFHLEEQGQGMSFRFMQYWWPAAQFSMLSLVHLSTASLVLVFAVASFAELDQ
jgi:hypothetical protein